MDSGGLEEALLGFDLFAGLTADLLEQSPRLCGILSDSYPIIILDEFQTWYEGLTNTKQFPWKAWAFNTRDLLKVKVQEMAPAPARETAQALADRTGVTALEYARIPPPDRTVPLQAYLADGDDWGLDIDFEVGVIVAAFGPALGAFGGIHGPFLAYLVLQRRATRRRLARARARTGAGARCRPARRRRPRAPPAAAGR